MTIHISGPTVYHREPNLDLEGVDVVKRLSVVALVLFVIGGLTLPVYAAGSSSAGDYVVVLKDSVSDPGAVASQHARSHGAQVGFVYESALKGYSATIPHHRVQSLRSDSRVDYIEVDAPVHTLHHRDGHDGGPPGDGDGGGDEEEDPPPPEECPGSQTLPWGIDRIDADLSSTVAGDCTGAISTNVYIIDTGVDQGHSDLNVVNHVSFIRGPNKDCHGHGTHVAGTVAARDNTSDVVGAAPGAPITGVKVLDCAGFGSVSTVVAGVDWVTEKAVIPAIANMSLGGGASLAIDDAVLNSVDAGIFYSVAAGNSGDDACNYSPARIGGANAGVMTVGATDSSDNDPSWSNFGSCVDIWAPGVSIVSTASGGGTATASGTSMASPHVGGTAALLLNGSPGSSPGTVESSLKSDAEAPGTKANDGASISLVNAQPY